MSGTITNLDRSMAQICVKCVLCSHARKKQRGFAFWVVLKVESHVCPFCRAYEKVYGRKAHETVPAVE